MLESWRFPLKVVGPTCRSARTRRSASLPLFRGSMPEDWFGRILSPNGERKKSAGSALERDHQCSSVGSSLENSF